MQAFSVNDDHAHNCCQAQCLVLCQLKIVKTQNRNQSVFTPVTVVSPPSHLGESHFLFLIHIHTTRCVHIHGVFTNTVYSQTQCVHMHSVTYIYMLHTLYYTQIPSWYYQRINACSSFLTWNIWAAFTVSLLKLLKLWTFHCTPIRGPSIPCTLDSLNHQTEYISSCLFLNYGHDVVHVQGTLCSWEYSNQVGTHPAPLKWLRMWPVQPSSLFRHNVYSFWRPVDAWESNVQYASSKEQTDSSNVKRIKSNYCIVLEDNFHFQQVFTRIKFVHVHLGRKLPYSTLNYSLPNNLIVLGDNFHMQQVFTLIK